MIEGLDMAPLKRGVICQPLPSPPALSTAAAEAWGDLSTVVASFADLERRRAARGISINAWLSASGVADHTYRLAKAGGATRKATLAKLELGLERLQQEAGAARPPAVIALLVRAIELLLLSVIGRDRRLMAACDPARLRRRLPQRVPAGRLRLIAIYVATVELEVKNAELARALGIERQAVKQSRDKIHDLRDTPAFDALVEQVAAALKARAAP